MHLSTHTWMRPEPLEVSLKRANRLQYRSIELAGEPTKHPVDETRTLLAKYNMRCWGAVTIMFGTRDLIAADAATRANSVAYVKDVVTLSSELGGQIITVVPSTVGKITPQAPPEVEWTWAVQALSEICSFARQKGIKVAIEPLNRFQTYFINRADQALRLADEVGMENCSVAFDPFHLHMEEQDMFAAIKLCGNRIFDVHLGDNNRLAPGQGSIDWRRFVDELRDVGYTGGLAFEAMPPIDRTPASPYRADGGQLEDEPWDVDEGTLEFLKNHASGVLTDRYYSTLLEKTADTILPLL
ncbi:MAG: hypothetical protein M1822_008286 [Bathelium mastoideum]|nr:MAG: hypothetical protein M1822_008286 [Bathelium mastoideum]